MNSGDWVENMTSLEYVGGAWKLFRYGAQEEASLSAFLTQLEEDQYVFPDHRKETQKDYDSN